jgi:peptide/nickel transport system permease protein
LTHKPHNRAEKDVLMPKFVLLWSDVVVIATLVMLLFYAKRVRTSANLRATWNKVLRDPAAMCSAVILATFFVVAVLDSVHFRRALPDVATANADVNPLNPQPIQQHPAYATNTESVLDVLLSKQVAGREATYSAPLALRGFHKDSVEVAGKTLRTHPRLLHGGAHLKDDAQWLPDVLQRSIFGLLTGMLSALGLSWFVVWCIAKANQLSPVTLWGQLLRNQTELPLRAVVITMALLCMLSGTVFALAQVYHVFGTDRTGNDVFYQALKSIRTAFVIGTLSTVATLPLAVGLGLMAGYLRGWVDELVQYIYTVLSSIPNVLLIAACVLMMQVFIDTHPDLFETGAERADVRLFLLCVILGLTGWATLCRLLRGEAMKLSQLDYVQAATAFGVRPLRIMARHIFPNVVHLIIITTVLDFSALVLYEAVLSYVGVGVDSSMNSFGSMINLARSEMSRDPLVWWSFTAAFGFMVTLVLAANLFADGVQAAFDPRVNRFRAPSRVPAQNKV